MKTLDRQLTQLELGISVPRIAAIVLAIGLCLLLGLFGLHQLEIADPYVKEVFALEGDAVRGQAMFQINCSGCHGIKADGLVGPSLQAVASRRSRASLIHQVIDGKTPPMPKFQPTPQEMADLLTYLESL